MTDGMVFSIGHSNLPLERFLLLLKVHNIDVLADVRSQPYSKWASQFNRRELEAALESSGIEYVYLGWELGGRPDSDSFYDAQGHVIYALVAESALFIRGIGRLEGLAGNRRVGVMCSEEDPRVCHRRLLVGRVLEQHGISMEHIRSNGDLQPEEGLKAEEQGEGVQLAMFPSMFPPGEDTNWRSVRPVRSIPSVSPSDEQRTSLGS